MVTMLNIRLYRNSDRKNWDSYVMKHPGGTIFHLIQWKSVIEETFGHRAYYLIAEDDGGNRSIAPSECPSDLNDPHGLLPQQSMKIPPYPPLVKGGWGDFHINSNNAIVGILPLFEIKSLIFGRYFVSVPFAETGGPIADNDSTLEKLVERAIELTGENRLDYLELRNTEPAAHDLPVKDLYCNFKKEIFENIDDNMKAIPRKARRMIRQGEKNNLSFQFGKDNLGRFYDLLARNYHHLGTPIFSSKLFDNFCAQFGKDCNILLILNDGQKPVSGVLFFTFKDQIIPYYAGSLVQYRGLAPNDFMYWQLMKYGCENGCGIFNFGRSKKETGSFHFKRHWNFEPKPLHYQYYLNKIDELPNLSPANPKYQRRIKLWQKLPFVATKILGPPIARYLA